MKYKLINGQLSPAPRSVVVGDRQIGNPSDEILTSLGYKDVLYTEPPVTEEGYIAVPSWEENENEIVQIWTVEEEGDISDEEAWEILTGGNIE